MLSSVSTLIHKDLKFYNGFIVFVFFFRKPALDIQELLSYLVETKYPAAHLFIDEIPVIWENQKFQPISVAGKH